ncbi:MAG: DUF2087 domain-containing protein [Rubrivivax sp.]|nr:DUF2087 domain-containing protein [Rubrivivax sp.]
MHAQISEAPAAPVLADLAALVVKDGVAIGGLAEGPRRLALALVWAGLPAGAQSERAVNEALLAQLAGPARCLDTDHVELRRWLVDAGWLTRDGFGREYRRADVAALPGPAQALGRALAGLDGAAFVDACRAEHAARRAARRRAHEQRQAPGAPAPRAG